jgi:hypothetical protein
MGLQKEYLIAAPPRSGTSMIAALLEAHGVWVGECGEPDEYNEMGYYENRHIVDIVKQVLKTNNIPARADGVFSVINKNMVSKYDGLREEILQAIGNEDLWLFKDTKLLLITEIMMKAFPEATWILPYRDKTKVRESILRHKVWERRLKNESDPVDYVRRMVYHLNIIQDYIPQQTNNYIWIRSQDLIDSEKKAKKFIEKCGLAFNPDMYKMTINPKLWHS